VFMAPRYLLKDWLSHRPFRGELHLPVGPHRNAQLLASVKTDDIGWNINTAQWQAANRLDPFYAELKAVPGSREFRNSARSALDFFVEVLRSNRALNDSPSGRPESRLTQS
jgi:hypothetical protein